MRKTLLGLAVTFILSSTAAAAAAPDCATRTTPGGKGITITRTCTAKSETAYNAFDGYYQVEALVEPGAGFKNRADFKKNSAEGKAIKSFLKTVFGASKASKLIIGLQMSEDGGTVYPVMPLLEFQIDDERWTSRVVADSRTLRHKLQQGNRFTAKFNYTFVEKGSLDLNQAAGLLTTAGLTVVTPAAQPLINVTNAFGNALLNAGAANQDSGYVATFSPGVDQRVEEVIRITDPDKGMTIADVTIRLVGQRSFLGEIKPVGSLEGTLPSGLVTTDDLETIGRAAATGQARAQTILQNALSSTKLSDLPLGTDIGADAIGEICAAASGSLSKDYQLSSFDNLLIRAKLIDMVTQPAQARVNPFTICFAQAADRQLIKKHLGIETDYVVTPSDPAPPFRNYEALYMIGCLLTGKEGDECGTAIDYRSRLTGLLADQVVATSLEGVSNDSPIFTDLPTSRTFTPAALFERFGGRFARFRSINAATGSLILHERADGPALRLEVRANAADKVRSIAISRL